jgi:hypothetical protein
MVDVKQAASKLEVKTIKRGQFAMPMKSMLWIVFAVAWPVSVWAGGNYTLTINGTVTELNLGAEQKLKLPDGKELIVKLERKDANIFTTEGVSFEYPGNLNVATSEIDEGIFQHLMASARGTLILVQTYGDLDATNMVDLMTGKMTDDDVAIGDRRDTKPHSRTLADGTILTGTRSTLKGPGDDVVVEVMAIHHGRGGTMLITRIDSETAPDEALIIERFWATLALK